MGDPGDRIPSRQRLTGRSQVLSELEHLVREAQARRGQVRIIQGGPGTGRTEVARVAVELAREARVSATFVEPSSVLPTPGAALRYIARDLGIVGAGPADSLVATVCAGLLQRATTSGLVIVIDDLQLLDELDLSMLRTIARPRVETGLAIVVTIAPHQLQARRAVVSEALHHLAQWPDAASQVLAPWTINEVDEYLRGAFSEPIAREFVEQALEFTGGTPLYLHRLAEDWAKMPEAERRHLLSGVPDLTTHRLPESLRHRVSLSAVGLPPGARRVLEALALWHGSATVDDLVALTDLDRREMAEHLGTLLSWDLAARNERGPFDPDGFHVANPVVARTIPEGMSAMERQELHRRSANRLEAQLKELATEDLVALARHYLGSGSRLTVRNLETVVTAGRLLNETSRYALTRELLEHVVFAGHADPAAQDLMQQGRQLLAKAYAHLDAIDAAERVLTDPQTSQSDPEGQARLLRQLGRLQVAASRDDAAIDIYQAIITSEPPPSATLLDSVRIDLSAVYQARGMPEESFDTALHAALTAEKRGDWEVAARAHARCGVILLARGESTAAVVHHKEANRLARRLGTSTTRVRLLAQLGAALVDEGRLMRAFSLLRIGYEHAKRDGDLASAARTADDIALAQIEAGELGDAEDTARAAVSLDIEMGRLRNEQFSRAVLDLARALQGDARPEKRALPHNHVDIRTSAYLGCADFERAMGAGSPRLAVGSLSPAEDRLRATPGWERYLFRQVLPRKARALFELRELGPLVDLEAEFRSRVQSKAHPMLVPEQQQIAALLALLQDEPERAARLFARARRTFEAHGHTLRALWCARYEGLALLKTTRESAAASRLSDTYRKFSELGAATELEALRADLRSLGRRPPGERRRVPTSGLTARETQIATLAVEGLSDADIARRLWISRRTVTTHMHNILHKLGLRSRVELGLHLLAVERTSRETT